MITPDSLLATATNLTILAEDAKAAGDPDAWKLRMEADRALLCGQFMEKRGIHEARSIGPFSVVKPKAGQRVRIKVGAEIHSTSKRLRRTLARAYTVTVNRFGEGHAWEERDIQIRNGEVTWVGTGGYWCWTDVGNVEIVA